MKTRNFSDGEFQKEFIKKMTDLYNYLASRNIQGGEVHFRDGLIFKCEIDTTNWINKPVIDLTKTESED